ncbi:MAG: RNA methyltransferase [Lachnospiraceae bacterium]|nr:RNA methyltransferase [Lachnospiraceae bacterium]
MEKITSPSNQKVKQLALWQKKGSERAADGIFLAEGTKLVREAPAGSILELYVSESFAADPEFDLCLGSLQHAVSGSLQKTVSGERSAAVPEPVLLSDAVFEKVSSMKTPQGVLAVLKRPAYSWGREGSAPALYLVLEDVQDPGNVGTMFRTAEAAGVTAMLLTPGCAEPLSPKVVRSAMGSVFRMPFTVLPMKEILEALRSRNVRTFAAHLLGKASYTDCDFTSPSALLIGNEGNGLTPETANAADELLRIPMAGQVESLNAAVSAAVLMYEAKRQRGLAPLQKWEGS